MKKTILILSLLLLLALTSCAHVKTVYFNDSDKIYAGEKGENIVSQYDYVVMSKGKFREMTTVAFNETGTYTCAKD